MIIEDDVKQEEPEKLPTPQQYGRDAWSYLTLLKRMYDEADKELAEVPEPSPMRVLVNKLVEVGDKLFYMKGKYQ